MSRNGGAAMGSGLAKDMESPPERGPAALFAAIRCIAESVQASIIGQDVETCRQLEQAEALLAEAARIARVYDDGELAAAVKRGQNVLTTLFRTTTADASR